MRVFITMSEQELSRLEVIQLIKKNRYLSYKVPPSSVLVAVKCIV